MKKLSLFLIFILCIGAVSAVYALDIQEDLSSSLVRMHIVANSNSAEDQSIKLAVRDGILQNVTADTTLSDISKSADSILSGLGAAYSASAQLERCYVPEKEYKNIRLPEGIYNCVKVVLGSGSGENWWCVAYPPLCFTEEVFGDLSEEGRQLLKEQLSEDSLKAIVKNGDINFRFKTLEIIQKLRRYISEN